MTVACNVVPRLDLASEKKITTATTTKNTSGETDEAQINATMCVPIARTLFPSAAL